MRYRPDPCAPGYRLQLVSPGQPILAPAHLRGAALLPSTGLNDTTYSPPSPGCVLLTQTVSSTRWPAVETAEGRSASPGEHHPSYQMERHRPQLKVWKPSGSPRRVPERLPPPRRRSVRGWRKSRSDYCRRDDGKGDTAGAGSSRQTARWRRASSCPVSVSNWRRNSAAASSALAPPAHA